MCQCFKKKSNDLVFKIFHVLVEILRKLMHQFSYIMMDFRRRRGEGTLDKIGNFLKSNFFLMLKLSKNSPNFQNHKTEINKKKLLVKLEKTATVITERESLWTGSMTGTGEREREPGVLFEAREEPTNAAVLNILGFGCLLRWNSGWTCSSRVYLRGGLENCCFWSQIWSVGSRHGSCARCEWSAGASGARSLEKDWF
jgi:hypothetical protein